MLLEPARVISPDKVALVLRMEYMVLGYCRSPPTTKIVGWGEVWPSTTHDLNRGIPVGWLRYTAKAMVYVCSRPDEGDGLFDIRVQTFGNGAIVANLL